MQARHPIAGVLPAAVMVLGASGVSGQVHPSKPIRIYANQPGGVFDFLARVDIRHIPYKGAGLRPK